MNVDDMDMRLRDLFDRQKRVHDPHLARLVGETESRWGRVLSDADLEAVAAAGEVNAAPGKQPWDRIR